MQHPEPMEIIEIRPEDDDLVAGFVAVTNAANEVDAPWNHPDTVSGYRGVLRHGWDGDRVRSFAGVESGDVVAQGEYQISTWDNFDLAWLWLAVRPDRRRNGLGTEMLEYLLELARGEGRAMVGTNGWDSAVTLAFAGRHGFERKSQAINRRQVVPDLDLDAIRSRYDEAASLATAYELVRIAGTTPDDLIEDVAVMSASINDAPTDDLEIEDEVFPPQRVRAYEDAHLARGFRLYRLLARHRESGELAGHTVVAVDGERPQVAHQHDTSVVRDHRGHRLGLLLKTGMVLWLADVEPQVTTVDTWNAESNDQMIAVNELLGYRALGRGVQFQRRL